MQWLKTIDGEFVQVSHIRTLKRIKRHMPDNSEAYMWHAVIDGCSAVNIDATDDEIKKVIAAKSNDD